MSVENDIATKRNALTEKLENLRASTMRFGVIGGDGTFAVRDQSGLDATNAQIAVIESQISFIDGALSEITGLYEANGVTGFQELNEKGAAMQNDLENEAYRCWKALELYRGEGSYGARCRTNLLPSDLCATPEFKAMEDISRAKIEAATIAVPLLRSARNRINQLTQQVVNL